MKRKAYQRCLALFLALIMVFGMSATVLAEGEASTENVVSDYETFLTDLELLEEYAASYVSENPSENVNALIINYIRTGVERYTSGTWATLAGDEKTAFTEYVSNQDAEKGTSVSALKNLDTFTVPNGDTVDFGHMFGTLDVIYYATMQGMTADVIKARADLGGMGWRHCRYDVLCCKCKYRG